jgi:hypothetical protein
VRHVLCAWTELEDGKNLGERIDGQPQPEHLCGAAQPGSDFVQLEVRDVEVAEAAVVATWDICSEKTERPVPRLLASPLALPSQRDACAKN